MEKFSDVQKLKDLVDVASKVKNPRLSGVKIALNDIYEQELLDFGSKTGAGFMDKLRQILDRNKNPNPNANPNDEEDQTYRPSPFLEKNQPGLWSNLPLGQRGKDLPGMTNQQVSDRLYPKGQNPNVKKGPGRDYIDSEDIDLSERWNTPPRPQPYNPLTREEEGGQQALDFDAPQQSGGPLSPPAVPGGFANPNQGGGMPGGAGGSDGASEGTTQVIPPRGDANSAGGTGDEEQGPTPEKTSEMQSLNQALSSYVDYLKENLDRFAENREMIDKINIVIGQFNRATGFEIGLIEMPDNGAKQRNDANWGTEVPLNVREFKKLLEELQGRGFVVPSNIKNPGEGGRNKNIIKKLIEDAIKADPKNEDLNLLFKKVYPLPIFESNTQKTSSPRIYSPGDYDLNDF